MALHPRGVTYAIDHMAGGDRIVRTVGLERIGQSELCARVGGRRDHEFDHRVIDVLDGMVRYVTETGARIQPGETVEHGWTLVQFLERARSLLEAHEIGDPFSNEPQPPVVVGIDRAIRLDHEARDTLKRNQLTGGDFPYRGMTGVSCVHLRSIPHRRLYMERSGPTGSRDSGWAIACSGDPHETEDLTIEHLAHIGADRRFVIPYLVLPVGTAIAFDEAGATVFPPGSNNGKRDPSDPYAFERLDLAAG